MANQDEILYQETFAKYQGLDVYFDFDQALECASSQGKKLLVVFGAWGGAKFIDFSETILTDPEIVRLARSSYVRACLYVDDKSPLHPNDHYKSQFSGELITRLGQKNSELQIQLLKSGSQPHVAIIDKDKNFVSEYLTGKWDKKSFKKWLLHQKD